MASVAPISPNDITPAKKLALPDEVVEAFNHLLAKNFSGGRARITQNEAIAEIQRRWLQNHSAELGRHDIFDRRWLDVEPLYREQGWEVSYDKPGYNERYGAYFIFSRGK